MFIWRSELYFRNNLVLAFKFISHICSPYTVSLRSSVALVPEIAELAAHTHDKMLPIDL